MNAPDTITLRNGLVVPVAVLKTAWELEDRGIQLRTEGRTLIVAPKDKLTPDEIAFVQEHRRALRVLVEYCNAIEAM